MYYEIETRKSGQQFLSILLEISIPEPEYKLECDLDISLNNYSKEPPHVFIKKDYSICYIHYDEIDFPLNYSIINDNDEVQTPYLKNWNDIV